MAGDSGGGGSCPVCKALVEGRVPLGKISAVAKEGLARASAALSQIAVFDEGGEGERVNAGLEGTGQLMELGAAFLVRDGALYEAEVMPNASIEFAEGSDGAAIASAAKGVVEPGKLSDVVRVSGSEVVVFAHVGAEHREALRIGIPGAKAETGIDVASQAAPTGFGVREKRWE